MAFWNIKAVNEQHAEIRLYGYIGRWMDIDEREFADQLRAVGDRDLKIYVNSDGGSVFTAITIFNMLNRHKGAITFYIDGIAASAMTIITSVPKAKVIAPVGSMMMVHAPLTDRGPMNAEEMRRVADVLDQVGGSIAGIYQQKTGLSEERIAEIMATDYYMTALEAVDLGFADEVEEQMDIAACITHEKIMIQGLEFDPQNHKNMPEAWFEAKGGTSKNENPGNPAGQTEAKEESEPMDLEKLKAENPELYAQIMALGEEAGIQKERERIQAIEALAIEAGHEDIIKAAKFDKPATAEAVAMQVLQAQAAKRAAILAKRNADNPQATGSEGVDPAATQDEKDEAERQRLIAAGRDGFTAKRK